MRAAAAAAEGQEQQPPRQGRFRASVIAAIVGSLVVVGALAIGLSLNGHNKRNHGAAFTAPAEVTPMAVPPLVIGSDAAPDGTTTTATTPSTTTTTPADQVNSGLFFDNTNKAPAAAAGAGAAATPPTSALNTALTTGVPPPLFGGLANNPLNAAYTGAVGRFANLGGLVTCYPKTGAELEKMVEGTSCTVILLTGGALNPYKTDKIMYVKSPKVIIGHPIDLPRIQANKGVERVFEVMAGGSLDVRFVSLFRAGGRSLDDGRLTVIVGGVILVQLGGYARCSGVVFRDAPQTFQGIVSDLEQPWKRKRTFGGHVLVMGGNFFCYGCQIIRVYPYGLPLVNVAQVGRDFLVIAGNCVTVGTYHIFSTTLLASINVGNAVAVLGGTCIRIGGGLVGASIMVGQFGAGQNLFVGGGVLVNVGHQQQSVFALMMRAGFAMSAVGGGVLIHIAELENRMWNVACILGAGQVYGNAAGVLDKTGGEVANGQVSVFQALVGGSSYCGAGEMTIVGESFARVTVTADQHGLGLTWFNGAGDMSLIYVPSYVSAVVRSQFILGAEAFMGAGFVTNVNNTRWSHQVVNAGIPGYEGYVAAGACLFIRSRTFVRRRVNFRLRPFSWIVNGVGVSGGAIAANNLYVSKDGIQILRPQPQKSRLLQAAEDAFPGTIARVTAADGSGLLSGLGLDRPSFLMAQSAMDSQKVNPPNPGILAKKIQEALVSVTAKRRLQGLPDAPKNRFFNVLAGLSPAKLLEAWAAAVEETAALANGGGAARQLAEGAPVVVTEPGQALSKEVDADGRWPEYVWVGGGEKTQCRMCEVGPGKTADHWTSGHSLETIPPPLTLNETEPATCQVAETCSDKPLGSMHEVMAAVQNMNPSDPLVLPPVANALFASKHTQRLLQVMHAGAETTREDGIKLPDTNILSYEVNLYCQPGAASCDYKQADLKSVMKGYLDKTAPIEAAYKLTAADGAVPSALLDIVNGLDDSFISNTGAPSSDKCGQGVKFLVHLTVPDKESVQNITKVIDDTATNTTPLLETLNNNQDQQFCDVTITKRGALFFPALDTPNGAAFYQGLYTGNSMDSGALWPDVTLVAPQEVAPVTDAYAGNTYSILLEGFSMKQDVTVQLFQGTAKTGTTVATVPGSMSSGDVRKVEWTAPAPDAAALAANGGVEVRSYLRAFHVGMPGVFAQSEVFNLEPAVGAQA